MQGIQHSSKSRKQGIAIQIADSEKPAPFRISHPFGPFVPDGAKVLILGSFPSVKSREAFFYYAHPQNRFYRVIATCYQEPIPDSLSEKKTLLIRHHLALWDVVASCQIEGSRDASIREVIPTDLAGLLRQYPFQRILLNGKAAAVLFAQYDDSGSLPVFPLPSTSSANATYSLEKLTTLWKRALL